MELFDNYLLGKLNPMEIQAFDLKLTQDSKFKSEFEEYKTIVLGIKDYSRNDLKNFLKEEKLPEMKMAISWKKSMQIAASLILLVGLGFLIKMIVVPNNNSTAITNAPEHSQQESEAIDTSLKGKRKNTLETVTINKDIAEREVPLKPSTQNVEQIETTSERNISSEDDNLRNEDVKSAAPATASADMDFNVLSEKKLRDTIIIIKLLVFNYNTNASKDNIGELVTVNTERKKAVKSLPAPANNSNVSNVNMNEKGSGKFKVDSILIKKNEKAALSKSYKLEFWQSPINFKGYKFNGNTIQLYGLDNKNVKLYDVNNTVYIKINSTVYKLKNCADACVYQTETDSQIVNFILEQ